MNANECLCIDGDPSTGSLDQDVTTDYAYHSGHLVSTVTVTSKKAGAAGTDVQTTTYVYRTEATDATPAVYRHDLVSAVIYADSTNTFDPATKTFGGGAYDRVEYKYDRQGEVVSMKDQNQTVHQYTLDKLGRQTVDAVPQTGANIDTAVLRIETAYEVRGMVSSVTSYDAASAGNVVDQEQFTYTDAGLPYREYQEHAGAVDGNTLYVQYNYDTAANGYRLLSVRYPNGRLVHYTYGTAGSAADALNRVDAIKDDDPGDPGHPGDTLAAYTYAGLDKLVVEDYTEPQVKLDYWGGTSGVYTGFDQFCRVIDQKWVDYSGTPTAIDEYAYGHDRVGDVTWRENVAAAAEDPAVNLDELYEYDDLYRMNSMSRGDLLEVDGEMTITSRNFRQTWTLDGEGNWHGFTNDANGDGTADLNQTRTVDDANQITGVSETYGQPQWVTPTYDLAGDMTSMPKLTDPTAAVDAVFDAWGRQVEVTDGLDVIAHYRYDGLGRRIERAFDTSAPSTPDGTLDTYEHFFYAGQEVVETRNTGSSGASPDTLQPTYQYVWSARGVDAPVLRDKNTDTDGLCDDGRVYFLTDANNNVTAVINASGVVQERYSYEAYGKPTIYNADWSATRSTSNVDNNLLFTGREFDPATGMTYFRARWLNHSTGGMTSRDPGGFAMGDYNLYRYVSDNPASLTDPSGMAGSGGGTPDPGPCVFRPLMFSPEHFAEYPAQEPSVYVYGAQRRTPPDNAFAYYLGIDDRTVGLMETAEGRVQLALETLYDPKSASGSKSEFINEAKGIAQAYVAMFRQNETWRGPHFPNDYRRGWMCYQWQTLTFNALEPLVKNSKYFDIRRVGLVKASRQPAGDQSVPYGGGFTSYHVQADSSLTLVHNWVAISAVTRPDGDLQAAPPGPRTVYLDSWLGNGPEAYCHTGVGYERGHPIHNFLGDKTLGDDASKPKGIMGYYMRGGGQPALWRDFPGWTW